MPTIVIIAGPTASGKSSLALALSRLVPSTIINADASQVYADLQILSARPSVDEMAIAPHQLFGHVDGADSYSAAAWAADARNAVSCAHEEGRLPILVGGTGLYLRTLLDGIAPIPEIDPAIRAEVRAMDAAELSAALRLEDADVAARLNSNDTSRLARALEVIRSTRRSILLWRESREGGIGGQVRQTGQILLPPRDWLFARCDQRFHAMLAEGACDEVEVLLARKLNDSLPVMRAIGVPALVQHLRGLSSLEEAITAGQLATRQYAKRQFTWFRNQAPAAWNVSNEKLSADIINKLAIKLCEKSLTA